MSDKIKNAFDEVKADEALKESTKAFIYSKTSGYQAKKTYSNMVARLASVAFAILIFGSSAYLYYTPVAAVSVDGSSSVELKVNRFNKVISVQTFDEEGQTLADTLNIGFKDYEEVVEEILVNATSENDVANDTPVSITVHCDDEGKSQEMISRMEQCEQVNQQNVHCYSSDYQMTHEAHNHGMSGGKYRDYLEQQANGNKEQERVDETNENVEGNDWPIKDNHSQNHHGNWHEVGNRPYQNQQPLTENQEQIQDDSQEQTPNDYQEQKPNNPQNQRPQNSQEQTQNSSQEQRPNDFQPQQSNESEEQSRPENTQPSFDNHQEKPSIEQPQNNQQEFQNYSNNQQNQGNQGAKPHHCKN